MASLEIIKLPDPRLRQKSKPVTLFDADLKKFIKDMSDSMADAKGIGLAAVQVGVHKRVLILDLGDLDENDSYLEGDEESEKRLAERRTISNLEVYINPEIVSGDGEIEYEEGCLSVPGVYCKILRKEHLKVRYQDEKGNFHTVETHGLRSIAMQHEIDHLNGIVFVDHLGPMQKIMVMNKYNKAQKEKKKEEELA